MYYPLGFDEYESAYSPYPDALIYMRYIIKVGDYITKNIPTPSLNSAEMSEEKRSSNDPITESNTEVNTNDGTALDQPMFSSSSEGTFNTSPFINQASVILALLYKKYQEKMLDLSLESLIECSTSIARDNW